MYGESQFRRCHKWLPPQEPGGASRLGEELLLRGLAQHARLNGRTARVLTYSPLERAYIVGIAPAEAAEGDDEEEEEEGDDDDDEGPVILKLDASFLVDPAIVSAEASATTASAEGAQSAEPASAEAEAPREEQVVADVS